MRLNGRPKKMLETAFAFFSEVITFQLGRFYLWAATLGRFKPSLGDRSQPLVSLFGGLTTLVLIVGIASWWLHL
jgi:hypothetical protein